MTKSNEVKQHYEQAVLLALEVVEEHARAILKAHKGLDEFVMGMGQWSFTLSGTKYRKSQQYLAPDYAYLANSKLVRFIGEWDKYLKLTGSPMRFTATGPKITDW